MECYISSIIELILLKALWNTGCLFFITSTHFESCKEAAETEMSHYTRRSPLFSKHQTKKKKRAVDLLWLLAFRYIVMSRKHKVERMNPASCAHLLNINQQGSWRSRGFFSLLLGAFLSFVKQLWRTIYTHFQLKCCLTLSLRVADMHSSVQKPLVERLIRSAASGIFYSVKAPLQAANISRYLFRFSCLRVARRQTVNLFWHQSTSGCDTYSYSTRSDDGVLLRSNVEWAIQ